MDDIIELTFGWREVSKMQNDRFADLLDENSEEDDMLEAGDVCPEDCSVTCHELRHPRDSQLTDCPPHPDISEIEVVCRHHGVMSRR